MDRYVSGRAVVPGSAEGTALVSRQPLSLWGGLNAETGEIIDRRHELSGATVTGRVFLLPRGKGSSTGSAVLLESIRIGTAPAAIITLKTEPIFALGSIVADTLYGRSVPIVVLPEESFHSIRTGDRIAIEPDGTLRIAAADGERT